MSLASRPLESLEQRDLQGLVENQVRERRQIEYKLMLPNNSDSDKREFLADVSSLANASGGYLIFGMDEDGGLPTALKGLEISDSDAEVLRLESIVRDGIDPRIPGLATKPIPIDVGPRQPPERAPKATSKGGVEGADQLAELAAGVEPTEQLPLQFLLSRRIHAHANLQSTNQTPINGRLKALL